MRTHINRNVDKLSPLRILLVEENEHDFLALHRTFERSRIASQVTRYVRGEDALARLEADAMSFDLLVTEYKLPGMSGLELCKELIHRELSVARVLLTGAKSEALALEALKEGFHDYLIKDPDLGYPGLLPLIFLHVLQKHRYHQNIKRVEKESKTQAPHGAIDENLTEMVCRFLSDKTLTYANDAYCRYFGAKREELFGKNFMRFIHKEDHERIKDHLASLRLENPVGKIQCRVLLSSGETRWQEWTNRAMFSEQGSLIEFQCVGLDISERKRAQDDLRLSEERFRYLVESVSDGFFVCEITSGNFLVINKRACDLFGYPMQEALTLSIWDMIAPEEHEKLKEDMRERRNRETMSPLRSAFTVVCKDGSEHKSEISAFIVSFQGEQVLQGIIRDMGEQEGLQEKLEKDYRIEGLTTLNSAIAYQFDSVLAEMTGDIGRLESDFSNHGGINKYIEPIYNATQRMARLSSQLNSFAGFEKYQPEIISLNEIAKEALALVRVTVDPSIQFETVLADDIPDVEADAAQIQFKLAVLIANTAEAIEGPGHIKIMTKTEVTDEEFEKTHPDIRPGQYVCLKFQAGGKKLNETATYKRIESFFSAGSGDRNLGVAVAPEIKEALGGRIAIDIYFPESVGKEILPEKLNAGPPDANRTILVVEDEEDEAGITRVVLEKLGYHVLEVKTGMDAINLARTFQGDIDLAFFDVVLPDMGGEELYSLLMETRPNLKAIACSGFATDALVQRLLDAGAQAFIQKPFTVSTVSEKLREILETKP